MRNFSAFFIALCLTIACGTSQDGEAGEDKTQDALRASAVNQRALMSRWNDAVGAVKPSIDFHWSRFDEFPHPTYKGGSAAAYEQFAAVLLKFLRDNVDFLASEDLFHTELRDVFANGNVALRTTFQELATEFSSTTVGNIPTQTREDLARFAQENSRGGQATEDQTKTSDAGTPQDPLGDSAANQGALMSRWNEAVDAVKPSINFHWSSFDEFPHPTYKQGTSQAYEQFAAVLLKYLQDNAEFLTSKDLFQTELRYVFPSGQVGLSTTFGELAAEFSTTKSGDIPAQTREELARFAHRK